MKVFKWLFWLLLWSWSLTQHTHSKSALQTGSIHKNTATHYIWQILPKKATVERRCCKNNNTFIFQRQNKNGQKSTNTLNGQESFELSLPKKTIKKKKLRFNLYRKSTSTFALILKKSHLNIIHKVWFIYLLFTNSKAQLRNLPLLLCQLCTSLLVS